MKQRTIILFALLSLSLCVNSLIVQTKNGSLRGKYMDIKSGKSIRAFLGVPYAEAPVGELRFKDPVAKQGWDGTKDATEMHIVCPQIDSFSGKTEVEGSEDCLFLNIYTPKNVGTDKLPVMVFIHGGAWFVGTAAPFMYGPDLLLEKGNVILVTMNYRLGALGFMSTGDNVVYGNMGLKDQSLALKWVKENIESFGGDSNSITIFGESAGAGSVHLQMLSPLSSGLFHAAISQSGTALAFWATQSGKDASELTKKLAKRLNCPVSSNQQMVECLREADFNEIIKNQMIYEWQSDPIVSFRPVIEISHSNAFIDKCPIEIIKSGNVAKVPWMTGITTEEGAMKVPDLIYGDKDAYNNDFERIAKYSAFINNDIKNYDDVVAKLKKYYFDDKSVSESTKGFIDLFTDSWFTVGADTSVSLMRKYVKSPIYFYLFGYKGEKGLSQLLGLKEDFGVCHGDDLQYLFTTVMMPSLKEDTEADLKMTDILTTLWTNFARYKEPTPIGARLEQVEWKPVQSNEIDYLYIGDNIKMESKMFEERVNFWRNLDIFNLKDSKDEL